MTTNTTANLDLCTTHILNWIRSLSRPLALVGTLLLLASPAWAATYQVVDFGSYGGGAKSTLNNSGQVATSSGSYAVIWNPADGAITTLGVLPSSSPSSRGFGINDLGHVTGQSKNMSGNYEAFYWNGSQMTGLGSLGGSFSRGEDVNDGGAVVGYSRNADGNSRAFLRTPGNPMQDLGTLGGVTSEGTALNNQNAVVGRSGTTYEANGITFSHAFSWTAAGGMTDLGTLIGDNGHSMAADINDANQVAGSSWWSESAIIYGANQGAFQAVLWEGGQITLLGFLNEGATWYGGTSSNAHAVNNLGQVVGTSNDLAFLWTEEDGMVNLNDRIDPAFGWTLEGAFDINDDGAILCLGDSGSGGRLVMLNPVPVPAAVWLLGSGLIGLVGLRRRSRL